MTTPPKSAHPERRIGGERRVVIGGWAGLRFGAERSREIPHNERVSVRRAPAAPEQQAAVRPIE